MNNQMILADIRQAHRICAAFYERIMPFIAKVGSDCNAEFAWWGNWDFNKLPSRNTTSPFVNECWDFLPLVNTHFVFTQQQNKNQLADKDFVLDIQLVIDDSMMVPDADGYSPSTLTTPSATAKSQLNVWLFKLHELDDKSKHQADTALATVNILDETWWEYEDYPPLDDRIKTVNNITATGFTVDLETLMDSKGTEKLVKKILSRLQTMA